MAGYNNYLIKVKKKSNEGTDYIIPMEYILEKSYKGPYSVLDTQSTRVASGNLVRKALPNKKAHCTIQLRALDHVKLASIFSNFNSRYTVKKERKLKLSVWVLEINDYIEGDFYIPDPDHTINHINDGVIYYEPLTLEFIQY